MGKLPAVFLILLLLPLVRAQDPPPVSGMDTLYFLNLPERKVDAVEGSDFAHQIAGKSIEDREITVVKEVLSGNVPSFSRKLKPLKITKTLGDEKYELICFVACDYLAVGSDRDYLYMPLAPSMAQYLADSLDCLLPTKHMVDKIYTNSEIKLTPQPIPPTEKMTTIPVFRQHTDSIKQQLAQLGMDRSDTDLMAGHKKDLIISDKIYDPGKPGGRVVIYGWHQSENNPIQPVYSGHIARYADYSHGVRFISRFALINGESILLDDVLKDLVLSKLLSDEGVIQKPYYPILR